MINFFNDILTQFNSATQLPGQLIKTSQAKKTEQQATKRATDAALPKHSGNFFADIVSNPVSSVSQSTSTR